MAKKGASLSNITIGAAMILGIIAAIPKEVWGVILGGIAIALLIWVVKKMTAVSTPAEPQYQDRQASAIPKASRSAPGARHDAAPSENPLLRGMGKADEGFASFALHDTQPASEHRIPVAPDGAGEQWRWVPVGEGIKVAGFDLAGGLLYVGSGLRSRYGDAEPALINPKLKVAGTPVDVSLRLTDYWANYARITPDARRAYLQWLADGRLDPRANIGYVFLFYYGLERRVLVDAPSDSAARADVPAIKDEIQRLLGIYGDNNSFRRYATHLLAYLDEWLISDKAYLRAPPTVDQRNYELPLPLKLGLGQLAADQVPVPADWALAWARVDPNISRRTPVSRCEAEFALLFQRKYQEEHGDGLVLKRNKTKLQFAYQPASSGFGGQRFEQNIGDLPDVSAVRAPIQKLQALVDACSEALDSYSRFIGRNPDKAHALEGLLQLPVDLWPAPVKAELEDLKVRVDDGMVVMTFGELSGRLKSAGPLSRDKVLGLARALQELHLGMEPDVLAETKIPKADDRIALFATPPEDGDARVVPAYQAAAITLDLSCIVVHADGEVSAHELFALTRHIDSWSHLSAAHRKRLKARLRLGLDQPATLAALKKKLETLAVDVRRSIVRFLAHLTQADGVVTPSEVKFLERTYKALGLDTKLVYTDLHASEAPVPVAATDSATPKAPGLALDAARIAQLQKETAEVSALLANVFAEEAAPATVEPEGTPSEEETAVSAGGILGLDADHSAFVRLLVTRGSWLRDELVDAASDMELMLDGALEHINEAALEAFDSPLTEGEDPIEINHEVLEALPV